MPNTSSRRPQKEAAVCSTLEENLADLYLSNRHIIFFSNLSAFSKIILNMPALYLPNQL